MLTLRSIFAHPRVPNTRAYNFPIHLTLRGSFISRVQFQLFRRPSAYTYSENSTYISVPNDAGVENYRKAFLAFPRLRDVC